MYSQSLRQVALTKISKVALASSDHVAILRMDGEVYRQDCSILSWPYSTISIRLVMAGLGSREVMSSYCSETTIRLGACSSPSPFHLHPP
jgi:hypothetical protein